jgi:para-aminobenzoate synthetase component 1
MAYYTWKSYKLKNDPWEIFCALGGEKNLFFLDSSLSNTKLGRFSFLGFAPFRVLAIRDELPFAKLREVLRQYQLKGLKTDIPFLGGAVGYLAYDLGFLLEKKVVPRPKSPVALPQAFFGFYNSVIVLDRQKRLLHIFCLGFPEKNYCLQKSLAGENLKKTIRLLAGARREERFPKARAKAATPLRSNFSRQDYLRAVRRAKDYIRAGDIYQVNLSQEFSAQTLHSAGEIYRRLRRLNPTPFAAYLDCLDFQVLSSSPERFLSLRGDLVTTRPMKGTRPRSPDQRRDRALRKALLNSPKDKAELVMIVDLERNDLGRVCSYNTVRASQLRQMEAYRTVFQTTATVCARLHKGKDGLDLLAACFPGGSITGAPKIRAMQIIEELEPHRRSLYTGSLGYLSFSGDMDFNILIRTILKKNNSVRFAVGGGIVADSSPESEYQETLVKARAMTEALA